MHGFASQGYSVDQQVGLMMEKLNEKGMMENTVIIYTSDNGRYHGSHGLYDKCLLHEDSVKAPLIVLDGRVPASKRGRREEALISSVDIATTILSLAGIEPPERMQARLQLCAGSDTGSVRVAGSDPDGEPFPRCPAPCTE